MYVGCTLSAAFMGGEVASRLTLQPAIRLGRCTGCGRGLPSSPAAGSGRGKLGGGGGGGAVAGGGARERLCGRARVGGGGALAVAGWGSDRTAPGRRCDAMAHMVHRPTPPGSSPVAALSVPRMPGTGGVFCTADGLVCLQSHARCCTSSPGRSGSCSTRRTKPLHSARPRSRFRSTSTAPSSRRCPSRSPVAW